MFSVQCTVSSAQCTVHSVQWAVFNVQCSACSVQCLVCSIQYAVYFVQCVVCSVGRLFCHKGVLTHLVIYTQDLGDALSNLTTVLCSVVQYLQCSEETAV